MLKGVLTKMKVELNQSVDYFLDFENDFIHINPLIGKKITLKHEGYECLNCKSIQVIYRQGFCKNCFFEMPSTADWIMKPELSKAHLNIEERDLEFEKEVQLKPHILYLAFSSSIKVGVTRKTQVPFRWIDQGAIKAIEIAELPNRFLAGVSEVELKKFYADKTNWREMLKIESSEVDLELEREKSIKMIPSEAKEFIKNKSYNTLNIKYPVDKYPLKPKSLNIIKENRYHGELIGIKGQYLIFKDDTVFNIRSNEGVVVDISF
ncbi:MAG: hypothetical protein CMC38_07775 [Flavobacteriaceae bacterium]|nr:hypothetical protein [Flavobacteriaceae bacterium]|tara:strand:+ start:10452 stop:11243 length:792 start_codon:yes stop_codon:yes gene_type:complete